MSEMESRIMARMEELARLRGEYFNVRFGDTTRHYVGDTYIGSTRENVDGTHRPE